MNWPKLPVIMEEGLSLARVGLVHVYKGTLCYSAVAIKELNQVRIMYNYEKYVP